MIEYIKCDGEGYCEQCPDKVRADCCLKSAGIDRPETILALDPGISRTGWVIYANGEILSLGVIKTKKDKAARITDDNQRRISEIAARIGQFLQGTRITRIAAELPTGGARSQRAAVAMAANSAMIATIAAIYGRPIDYCSPQMVKLALSGETSASKEEMIQAAVDYADDLSFNEKGKIMYNGDIYGTGDFEHIADAIGVLVATKKARGLDYGGTAKG